jgi:Zn-dependent membrane protease YugP
MFIDPLYLVMLLPAFLLSMFASFYVKSTFSKYSKVPSVKRMTGAEAALEMLNRSGVNGVTIERSSGFLSDHYDPRSKTLRLSADVYDSSSLAAIGVACHEAGHALQDAQSYAWLGMRTALVPVANFGSNFSYIILMVGFLFGSLGLVKIGIGLFSLAVLFTIVTLPVEWNASARAKKAMVDCGIVGRSEAADAGAVLNAAFLTYVAAAVSAILTLLYYLLRSGLLGGRRD